MTDKTVAAAETIKAGPSEWIDAQDMQRQNPQTFEAPTARELAKIKVGDAAKICNGRERFWVQITTIGPEKDVFRRLFTARVNNDLLDNTRYDAGDLVQLEGCNIYAL